MPAIKSIALGLGLTAALVGTALAQNPAPTPAPAAAPAAAIPGDTANPPPASTLPDVAKQVGIFVYPGKGQSPDRQRLDENQCYAWAQNQSSVDPNAPGANRDSAAAVAGAAADQATTGAGVAGAARGAAGGAVVGAIVGDAGTGAAIGAVSGAAAGRRAKRAATRNAEAQGAAHADAVNAQNKETFKKAMTVCLEGRGYSVK